MKTLKNLFTLLLLLAVVPVFALTQDVPDVTNPASLVVLLMPAITWLAVEAAKKISTLLGNAGIAGGWILGLIVPGLSALLAYLLTLVSPDASFGLAFVLGLGSTFINELILKVKGEPTA
jgi:hypothetical protein